MQHQNIFVVILGICAFNGIFSPYLIVAVPITLGLLPEFFPRNQSWVLFFSSIFVSTFTLVLSGVPAALFERFTGRTQSDEVSMCIWLGGAVLLTLPASFLLAGIR